MNTVPFKHILDSPVVLFIVLQFFYFLLSFCSLSSQDLVPDPVGCHKVPFWLSVEVVHSQRPNIAVRTGEVLDHILDSVGEPHVVKVELVPEHPELAQKINIVTLTIRVHLATSPGRRKAHL